MPNKKSDQSNYIDSWIQTYTGKVFYPLTPNIKHFDIIDIAHSLSLMCRYVGHIEHFYSVAQHSVIVANYFKDDLMFAKWGLMHDAPEAYIVDVPSPIKKYLNGYCDLEDQYTELIAEKYALPYPIPNEVKEIDTRILITERQKLMAYDNLVLHDFELVEGLDVDIPVMLSKEAELQFLQKYIELFVTQ